MMIGQTVWYRMTQDNAVYVESVRYLRPSLFQGDEVSEGDLLPATVVRMHDKTSMEILTEPPEQPTDFHCADIRVLLPGNDMLFVRKVLEDHNPVGRMEPNRQITALPIPGCFTQSAPAQMFS